MAKMRAQAERFGTVVVDQDVDRVDRCHWRIRNLARARVRDTPSRTRCELMCHL
jgi:hypothetical protein